eukprot:jgi/Astpho2/6331/Aster-05996
MKSKPGSGKRQDRNFEIVVNHISINEAPLPQVATAAIKAGTPELQCKTYDEFQRLLEAAAESVI